jgi:putative DNA modification/repair radical SAM protein
MYVAEYLFYALMNSIAFAFPNIQTYITFKFVTNLKNIFGMTIYLVLLQILLAIKMKAETLNKLQILANAAKYDVSCASSGSNRPNQGKGIGNAAPWGICHSFAEDGRCISLLKIMLTNVCMYDCAYCINRRSNDMPRATFTPDELVELTIEFYRRNYIEGLFLSSGVIKNPDYTMEQMLTVVKKLRTEQKYHGYIHMKSIPGASREMTQLAGLYVDRLSVNIEIPTEENLKFLAPEKNYSSIMLPMQQIKTGILENKEERAKYRSAPQFVPGGQSTQIIIGATPDNDKRILTLASSLYTVNQLKRVYYSGYIPVNNYDQRLPAVSAPPMVREHRLYQADWLLRFYQFKVDEIVNDEFPDLDLEVDPKLSYALRHPELFPVDINKAPIELIVRIPGVGVKSAKMIVAARRYGRVSSETLKKIGVVMKKAQYFMTTNELKPFTIQEAKPETLRQLFVSDRYKKKKDKNEGQLSLFTDLHFV